MASLLHRNTLILRSCQHHHYTSVSYPILKFPTNSRSIYQFTTRSLHRHFLRTPHSTEATLSPFYHLSYRKASAVSKSSKKRNSTPNALNAWNLSYNTRSILRWLGYWSPRIVIIAWAFTFVCSGAYLLKKSIDTDGFSTQFSPGTGGDINKEDWTMITHEGVKFSKADSIGKYLLIYFGFTFCPDVCPVEMTKLAQIADILESRGIGRDLVQPVFVSVDHRRDTPEMIGNYIKQYTNGDDSKILGLCGTREQMEHFARVMKTYFSDPPQLEEDYILEHSTYMYFTGTDGSFRNLTNTEDGAEVLANKVALWVAEDKGRISKITEQVKQVFR